MIINFLRSHNSEGNSISSSQSLPTPSEKIVSLSIDADFDSFELSAETKNVEYRKVFKHARALRDEPMEPIEKLAWPEWETIRREEKFIKNPTTKSFFKLNHEFDSSMLIVGHQKYRWLNDIVIKPKSYEHDGLLDEKTTKKMNKLEEWHVRHAEDFVDEQEKETQINLKRQQKIAAKGLGRTGRMSEKVGKYKAASFYAKNNFTIRGNVFKLTHRVCPKNIFEIRPRDGFRKNGHIGVRVSQFTITTFLAGAGYALAPISFGVSKVVTDHTRTLVTLSGEAITHKIAGADKRKLWVHAGLRGVQLEVPRLIPIVGDIVNIGESTAFGVAAFGIVSTTIADMLLAHCSTRYQSTLNVDDLGDSRCLAELNSRIDYLSQFLLPYGQYLLLKETDIDQQKKLKNVLKKNFKILRDLEKKKTDSLNFYRLALLAGKIPESLRDQISRDCQNALPDTRVNTHRIVKRCLSTLIENDPQIEKLRDLVIA